MYYMHNCFNLKKLHILPHRSFMFPVIIVINSDYFTETALNDCNTVAVYFL
jgi:cytochrome c oxidase assembly protein Cox11